MEYIISILMLGAVFFCLKLIARLIDYSRATQKEKAIAEGKIEKKELFYRILLETEHDIFVGGDRLDLEQMKKVLDGIGETKKYIVFVTGEDFSKNEYAHCENGEIKFTF